MDAGGDGERLADYVVDGRIELPEEGEAGGGGGGEEGEEAVDVEFEEGGASVG